MKPRIIINKPYFGGKIGNTLQEFEGNSYNREYNKRMLKSFLQGQTHFIHGKNEDGSPKYHLVKRSETQVL